MKHPFLMVVLTFCVFSQYTFSQETVENPEKYTAHNKGKFFVFWGGNRENFSNSDINFSGNGYNFTLYDVTAHDKPKGWHVDYVNPGRMTIPQTNLRFGYFISDHYNVSIGVDHMKYVMFQDKVVKYSGNYPNRGTFGEDAGYNQVLLTEDFLTFEHTDGLNYVNTEISRVDAISDKLFKSWNSDKVQINVIEGIGVGLLYPKTNAKVFDKPRHDDFHVSGFGASAKVGLNFTFFKHFILQTELKGGYINMNDIRTTNDPADRAKQHFWFLQRIIAFGGVFKI